MFNRKLKLTIPHIDIRVNMTNKQNIRYISASNFTRKSIMIKRHHTNNISLPAGDRVTIKQRKLNKLTPIFEPTSYRVICTKGTLVKADAENSDRVVTRNISHSRRIPKDAVFPKSTSDEPDDDFEYTRHDNNDNQNHNNRRYPLCNRKPFVDIVLL